MQNKKPDEEMNNIFQQAISNTKDIKNGYMNGLQALGSNAGKVVPKDSKKIRGSVDIDKYVKDLYPEDPRWDYAIGYDNDAYFLEVHPANTSDVTTMINKAKWLSRWLDEKSPALKCIAKKVYYWVPSGKYNILPNTAQYKKLAQSKIRLVSTLSLPQ